ncbi:MAG: alkaline phosphatase family protein [Gammaproteobacteria bacterium]|nr:alkaline phosphatase family protein [Gammaproteobacteria bacterium]
MRTGLSNITCRGAKLPHVSLLTIAQILLAGCVSTTIIDFDSVEDPPIASGPMLGHVSDSSARVWLRLAAGAALAAHAEERDRRYPAQFLDLNDGFRLVLLEGLPAGAEFTVTLEAKTSVRDSRLPGTTRQIATVHGRTAPKPANTGKVRLAFGSCSKASQFRYAPIYEAIAFEKPDFAIYVGDNSYFVVGDGNWRTWGPDGDWSSPERMIRRHMEVRNNPYGRRLYATVPAYAIWDDHDYGPNNADRTFAGRRDALRVFTQVWANPTYGTPDTPGVFSSFRHGPVEVFLMDDRYHKYVATRDHPDVADEDAVIWGTDQLTWLMDGLMKSTAPVKIIANGTQVISQTERGEGHFQEAPAERKRLFDFLKANKIGGIVFLSGDRHHSESMRLDQNGAAAIVEFTSSPLQQNQQVRAVERNHPTNQWALRGNTYGLVTIDIPREGEGRVTFEARNDGNQLIVIGETEMKTTVPLGDLYY